MVEQVEAKVSCPRCDQDWVHRAKVNKTGEVIFVCPECEAVWFSAETIAYATFNYLNLYMERLDLVPYVGELTFLDPVKLTESNF